VLSGVDFAKQEAQTPLRAIGVTMEDGTRISASEEVILSVGAAQSPGLLDLSRMGRPEILNAAGITQLFTLSGVGENFQDHIRISNAYRLKSNTTSFDPMIYDNSGKCARERLQHWLNGTKNH
jgi:choline dehydrogenase-like flavoprotein